MRVYLHTQTTVDAGDITVILIVEKKPIPIEAHASNGVNVWYLLSISVI